MTDQPDTPDLLGALQRSLDDARDWAARPASTDRWNLEDGDTGQPLLPKAVVIPPIPRPCKGCGATEAQAHIDDCPEVRAAVTRTGTNLDDTLPAPVERRLYRFWAIEPGHDDQEWIGWWRKSSATWYSIFGDGMWSADYVTRWEPVELGTSRSRATRATPAQVEAAMEALDCRREFDELTLTMFCAEHHVGWLRDVGACARAERVADAVVAAGGAASSATGGGSRDDAEGHVPTGAVIDALRAEVERVKSAAKTLGGIVHEQAQMALDATGRHDLIEADGDGDWQTVWELLAELRPRAEAAERTLADERAKVAHLEAAWRRADEDANAALSIVARVEALIVDPGTVMGIPMIDAWAVRRALAGPEPEATCDTCGCAIRSHNAEGSCDGACGGTCGLEGGA